jgi:hypothetical protein
VLALAWTLGFELGPLAHLALHGVLAPHSHSHASGERHADHDDDTRAPSDEPHGEGSLAHRDVAALVPLPAIAALLGAPIAEVLDRQGSADPCIARAVSRARARAPPA